ncbi:MAG: 23S rRNA (pseudouridine(1915)-N(3))-methyltransferase RlmH [Candidatus Buchananbacteria bacterium]|nr:23S rRNA (pseudouridine(1915)-N(3))-methyltransferase RlmH [Candidatus Buchananbacteria bacterium]
MLNITILAVGKIKEKSFLELVLEYLKRLKPYAKIKIEELKAEPFNPASKNKAREIEGERIINFLKKFAGSRVVLLDERGKSFSSLELADFISDEKSHFIFVIGGSLGLSENVKEKIKSRLSLSKLTFPHEMARVILLEQIYRSVAILKNKEYHY